MKHQHPVAATPASRSPSPSTPVGAGLRPARLIRIDPLEPRRLFNLAVYGSETIVPPPPASSTPNYGQIHDMAVAGNGDSLIASVNSDRKTIQIIRYAASGARLGGTLTITPPGSVDYFGVSTSMDADGDAVVAYVAASTKFFGGERVYFNRIARDGTIAPAVEAAVPTSVDAYLHQAKVSMDSGGGFFLSWIDGSDEGWNDNLQVRPYDATGNPRGAVFTTATTSTSNYSLLVSVDIASKPDGSGLVFASDVSEEGPTYLSFGVATAAGTVTFGDFDSDGGEHGNPAVAVHPDGTFEMSYDVLSGGLINGPFDSYGVHVQRFDASAKPVGNAIELGQSLPGNGPEKQTSFGSIAPLPDGGFVAGFLQTRAKRDTLYVRRYLPGGIPDDAGPVPIGASALPGVNDNPWLAPTVRTDANGRAIVFYRTSLDGPVAFRRLTTRTAELFKSELYVLGTNSADTINIAAKGASIMVTQAASTRSFPASRITALSVNVFAGNDSVANGTALPSTIIGGEGNDKIQGGLGIDSIHGNGGADSLWGGDNDDFLFGDGGIDSLSGQGGRDWIEGGDGADLLRGYGGRDKMFGGGGDDRIYGGESDDWLYGQGGNDQLFGGPGHDRLYGDAGNDLLSDRDNTRDTLYGGAGNDSATLDHAAKINDLWQEIEKLI